MRLLFSLFKLLLILFFSSSSHPGDALSHHQHHQLHDSSLATARISKCTLQTIYDLHTVKLIKEKLGPSKALKEIAGPALQALVADDDDSCSGAGIKAGSSMFLASDQVTSGILALLNFLHACRVGEVIQCQLYRLDEKLLRHHLATENRLVSDGFPPYITSAELRSGPAVLDD